MEITNPYINTKLSATVGLRPDQMDNKFYIYLKENLKKKLEGKCYLDNGYIEKIYRITNHDSGIIDGENLHGSAKFKVDFALKLCRPLARTNIIGKVMKVNKALLAIENGPIVILITGKRYNKDIFFTDNNNSLRYKLADDKSEILKTGTYVIVNIESIVFYHGDEKIIVIGYLQNIATDTQVKKYHDDINDEDSNIIDIKEYLES